MLSAVRRVVGGLAAVLVVVALVGADDDARYGASGDVAVRRVLEDAGYVVTYRLRPLGDLDAGVDVLLLDQAGVAPSEQDWEALRGWVEAGGVLWLGGPPPEAFPELGVGTIGRYAVEVGKAARPIWPEDVAYAGIEGGTGGVVVGSKQGPVLVARIGLGAGVVVNLADPRLLWNGAMVAPVNESFLLGLVERERGGALPEEPQDTRIELALVSAAGAESPMASLLNGRLLPFVAQLLVTMALAGLWLGWPFSPLADPPSTNRASFAEHVRALGDRYARLRASSHVYRAAARYVVARFGVPGLVSAAERAGRSPSDAAAFARRVQSDAQGRDEWPDATHRLEELWNITRPR